MLATFNFRLKVGKARKAVYNGREYLVAPMTLIVPGILEGSKGALYYPPAEVARNFRDWDGVPLTAYHPKDPEGRHVSALSPGILKRQCIGFNARTHIDLNSSNGVGVLKSEGWFDLEKTREVDSRIYNALVRNQPIELSTGLYTDNDRAPEGANYKGRKYDYIARNYRPDHIAVLPDEVGACSLNDGCGVLINKSKEKQLVANKDQHMPTTPGKKLKPIEEEFEDPSEELDENDAPAQLVGKQKSHDGRDITVPEKREFGDKGLAASGDEDSHSPGELFEEEVKSSRKKGPGVHVTVGNETSRNSDKENGNSKRMFIPVLNNKGERVFVINPAVSEAQRKYLNWAFGHDWVKEHGFDNRGPLPEYKEEGSNTHNTDDSETPHSMSKKAAGASLNTEHSKGFERAKEAFDSSSGGDQLKAASSHEKAAAIHERAATRARKAGDSEGAKSHDEAAALHRKAASLHRSFKSEGVEESHNKTHNQKGRKMFGKQLRRIAANCSCAKTKAELLQAVQNMEAEDEVEEEMEEEETPPAKKKPAFMKKNKGKGGKGMSTYKKNADTCNQDEEEEEEELEENAGEQYHSFDLPPGSKFPGQGQQQAGGAGKKEEHKLSGNTLSKQVQGWLESSFAPPAIREIVENAVKAEEEQKKGIVLHLISNVRDSNRRNLIGNKLMKESVQDLQERLELMGSPRTYGDTLRTDFNLSPSYFGAGGGPISPLGGKGLTDNEKKDILPLPRINWGEIGVKAGPRNEQPAAKN